MLDIRFIQKNVDMVRQNTIDRYADADVDKTVSLYTQLKQKRQSLMDNQHRSNQISNKFKVADATTRDQFIAEANNVKQKLS